MKNLQSSAYLICCLVVAWLLVPWANIYAQDQEAGGAATLSFERSENYATDSRVMKLREYLVSKKSPLAEEARSFVEISDMYNLNWKFIAAIAGLESSFGNRIPTGSYNAWGWGVFTGQQSGVMFQSWEDGIEQVSQGIRFRYINRGAKTVEQIGSIYAASPTWAVRVIKIMDDIENFASNDPQAIHITL